MTGWLNVAIALAVAALISPPNAVDETLASARSLYAAAEYEQSLALLNALEAAERTPDEARSIGQYRAYCLLALGRPAEAEQAIAAIVATSPLFRPSATDASPRIQAAFRDVRVKMLPVIVQTRYAAAKASFDAKRFPEAEAQFTEVLDALGDPDLTQLVTASPLADIRTLAAGFRDLSAQTAAPPPPPAPVSAPVPPPPAAAPVAAVVTRPRIFSVEDRGITPPIAVQQALPAFPPAAGVVKPGVLEIVIDERGEVESAAMREPISARYDTLMVGAAKKWKYRPATLDGAPVKYRKMMQVNVQKAQ